MAGLGGFLSEADHDGVEVDDGLHLVDDAGGSPHHQAFRAALADLGLSQVGFARLALVDARTVRRWCDGTRAVPGPVVALLRLMAQHRQALEAAI